MEIIVNGNKVVIDNDSFYNAENSIAMGLMYRKAGVLVKEKSDYYHMTDSEIADSCCMDEYTPEIIEKVVEAINANSQKYAEMESDKVTYHISKDGDKWRVHDIHLKESFNDGLKQAAKQLKLNALPSVPRGFWEELRKQGTTPAGALSKAVDKA